ncbi:MAG TPA: ankyrin repeat domain-containing protein [Tepidisphaeraceae bacterium]|jgi:ankyrin repeat protein|nr:ankyrin repeat domain-containing protein [Tepidisphaeraceae bacterium]
MPGKYINYLGRTLVALLLLVIHFAAPFCKAGPVVDKTPQSEDTLMKAVTADDYDAVTALIKSGVSANSITAPPLCIAVTKQNLRITKFLLENGADPNSVDRLGRSALFSAIDQEDLEAAKVLLQKGADPNLGKRLTPLMLAACNGSNKLVALLVENKAHVDTQTEHGETALYFAVIYGHLDVVRTLVTAGADRGKQGVFNLEPIDYVRDDEIEIYQVLRSGNAHPASEPASELDSMMLDAVETKDNQRLERLIKWGANLNSSSTHPLCAAARNGNVEALKLFLDKGADPDSVDAYSRSAIYLAAERGDVAAVQALVDKGANINLDSNMKPLMTAASHGYGKVVALLSKNNLQINAQTTRRRSTALHFAVQNGDIETVRALVAAGADPNIQDESEHTPFDYTNDDQLDIREALKTKMRTK